MAGRYHIPTRPAPPGFPYPARFRLGEGDDYVKYGHAPFEQGRRGGDPHWTPEIISQIWYQSETGRIPISTFGGLKARGNPGGATGVYQAEEVILQLRGEAGPNQVKDARWGMAQCLGGAGATAVTHIFERTG